MGPKGRKSRLNAESGERGSKPPPTSSGVWKSTVSSPSRVWGRAPTAQRLSTIFSTQLASPDTIILLILWITEIEKFLSHSILSQLCVWWCWMVFLYMTLNSRPEKRKWWSSLQGRAEVVGWGTRHFEGEFSPRCHTLRQRQCMGHAFWRLS